MKHSPRFARRLHDEGQTSSLHNTSARKTADTLWRLRRGTGTTTWEVFKSGYIELELVARGSGYLMPLSE